MTGVILLTVTLETRQRLPFLVMIYFVCLLNSVLFEVSAGLYHYLPTIVRLPFEVKIAA